MRMKYVCTCILLLLTVVNISANTVTGGQRVGDRTIGVNNVTKGSHVASTNISANDTKSIECVLEAELRDVKENVEQHNTRMSQLLQQIDLARLNCNSTKTSDTTHLLAVVRMLSDYYTRQHASNSSEIATLMIKLNDLTAKENTLEMTVAALQAQLTSVDNKIKTESIYVRWGRKTCPGNGTTLVYSGFSGGSYYSHMGGTANFMCMPPDPIYEPNASTDGNANVYGVEYQSTFYGSARLNDDMPCSLCRSSRSNVILLPGRDRCHAGWTLEYHGWLAGAHIGHSSSEYICLDNQPEALQHSIGDEQGRLVYLVTSQCGSLPCPPYESGKSLSCAVCSI